MNSRLESREGLQFAFLIFLVLGILSIFFLTPSLRPASLLTVLSVLFLGPPVRFLKKRGIPKVASIIGIYLTLGIVLVFGMSNLVRGFAQQWSSLIDSLPVFGQAALAKLTQMEAQIQDLLNIEINFGFKNALTAQGSTLRNWALTHVPSLIGDFASAMLLAPIFSFFLLKDGEAFRSQIEKLIPKSRASATIAVLDKIGASLGKFLRATLIEAFALGFICFIGLKLISAPYAGIFALIAGITNIIPYLGPILGVVPPILVLGFSNEPTPFWPMVAVFTIANAIDMVLIFPVFVAKLVNLSPLTLLASVAVGQELYGVIGMLLAVPVASILKIIFQEVVSILY
jgi:putative permease